MWTWWCPISSLYALVVAKLFDPQLYPQVSLLSVRFNFPMAVLRFWSWENATIDIGRWKSWVICPCEWAAAWSPLAEKEWRMTVGTRRRLQLSSQKMEQSYPLNQTLKWDGLSLDKTIPSHILSKPNTPSVYYGILLNSKLELKICYYVRIRQSCLSIVCFF